MNRPFRIFVEGDADVRFISQLLKKKLDVISTEENVIKTTGWQNLVSEKVNDAYVMQMRRNTDDGGVNLVIFDADEDCEERRKEILRWKEAKQLEVQLFLLPNNRDCGALEDLLEAIINPANSSVMNCWENYESCLKEIRLPWKEEPLTLPAKKTKIYAYLEVLLGKSKSQKRLIKETERDYTNTNHWDLDAEYLNDLAEFLRLHLQ